MSDFPSMHARDAAKLPHVSLEELSARVPRASSLVQAFTRAKPYDPKHGPCQTERASSSDRTDYYREYKRAQRTKEKKP